MLLLAGRSNPRQRRHIANTYSKIQLSFSISTAFCAICAHMPRSPELGISCPPFHEYVVRFLSSTRPLVRLTKYPIGSLFPCTKSVGTLIGVPEIETSNLLRPLASNGGKAFTRTRHLTLCGWRRRAERAPAPPSECAKMTSGLL